MPENWLCYVKLDLGTRNHRGIRIYVLFDFTIDKYLYTYSTGQERGEILSQKCCELTFPLVANTVLLFFIT